MLNPKEKEKYKALQLVAELELRRKDSVAQGNAFDADLAKAVHDAELAYQAAHTKVSATVTCERCGRDVDLDSPQAVVFHVQSYTRVAADHPVQKMSYLTTPIEFARCEECSIHLFGYEG